MRVTIEPGQVVNGRFVTHESPGPDTLWWWQVDDDDAVYSGSCATEAEAWREANDALGQASVVMTARAEGVTAGLSAMRARAEAAEQRAAAAEAALRQAQEDARLMAGMVPDFFLNRFGTSLVNLSQTTPLRAAIRGADALEYDHAVAIIRRALGMAS